MFNDNMKCPDIIFSMKYYCLDAYFNTELGTIKIMSIE